MQIFHGICTHVLVHASFTATTMSSRAKTPETSEPASDPTLRRSPRKHVVIEVIDDHDEDAPSVKRRKTAVNKKGTDAAVWHLSDSEILALESWYYSRENITDEEKPKRSEVYDHFDVAVKKVKKEDAIYFKFTCIHKHDGCMVERRRQSNTTTSLLRAARSCNEKAGKKHPNPKAPAAKQIGISLVAYDPVKHRTIVAKR